MDVYSHRSRDAIYTRWVTIVTDDNQNIHQTSAIFLLIFPLKELQAFKSFPKESQAFISLPKESQAFNSLRKKFQAVSRRLVFPFFLRFQKKFIPNVKHFDSRNVPPPSTRRFKGLTKHP